MAAHVDAAALELRDAAFEPLDAGGTPLACCMGSAGFWVQRYLDPGDPPPAYGLFSHVRLDVLEAPHRPR